MLATKRLAGATAQMNWSPSKGIQPGFETQGRSHHMSNKTEVPVAPQKELISYNNQLKVWHSCSHDVDVDIALISCTFTSKKHV